MNKIILIFAVSFAIICNIESQTKIESKENCGNIINNNVKRKPMESGQKNVLGTDLQLASLDPITGFFRTGYCATDQKDRGLHVVAAVVTDKFLKYSLSKGNDLISPYPANGFPGLKQGDIWCLCALRWKEALAANCAPPIILEATNAKALEFISLKELKQNEFVDSKK